MSAMTSIINEKYTQDPDGFLWKYDQKHLKVKGNNFSLKVYDKTKQGNANPQVRLKISGEVVNSILNPFVKNFPPTRNIKTGNYRKINSDGTTYNKQLPFLKCTILNKSEMEWVINSISKKCKFTTSTEIKISEFVSFSFGPWFFNDVKTKIPKHLSSTTTFDSKQHCSRLRSLFASLKMMKAPEKAETALEASGNEIPSSKVTIYRASPLWFRRPEQPSSLWIRRPEQSFFGGAFYLPKNQPYNLHGPTQSEINRMNEYWEAMNPPPRIEDVD